MYHYTECGLQNVWLENGYKRHKTPYGGGVAIDDVEGLHAAIGRVIARRPRLTGAELRFLRKEMEMSQRALADLLGTSEQNVSLWERRGRVPQYARRLVKAIYVEHLEGHVQIRKMIDALIAQDEDGTDRLHFTANGGRWKMAA